MGPGLLLLVRLLVLKCLSPFATDGIVGLKTLLTLVFCRLTWDSFKECPLWQICWQRSFPSSFLSLNKQLCLACLNRNPLYYKLIIKYELTQISLIIAEITASLHKILDVWLFWLERIITFKLSIPLRLLNIFVNKIITLTLILIILVLFIIWLWYPAHIKQMHWRRVTIF